MKINKVYHLSSYHTHIMVLCANKLAAFQYENRWKPKIIYTNNETENRKKILCWLYRIFIQKSNRNKINYCLFGINQFFSPFSPLSLSCSISYRFFFRLDIFISSSLRRVINLLFSCASDWIRSDRCFGVYI